MLYVQHRRERHVEAPLRKARQLPSEPVPPHAASTTHEGLYPSGDAAVSFFDDVLALVYVPREKAARGIVAMSGVLPTHSFLRIVLPPRLEKIQLIHHVVVGAQEIYKAPDFLSMGRSLAGTAMLLHDSLSFVMGQVVFDGQRKADCDATRTTEMAKMKFDIGRMTMKVLPCVFHRAVAA